MAQKTKVIKPAVKSLGIFSRTGSAPSTKAQADNSDLVGSIKPVGVGITAGEKEALKTIAESNDLTLNGLMRFALRRFIVDVRAGKINLEDELAEPEPVKKRLKMPS